MEKYLGRVCRLDDSCEYVVQKRNVELLGDNNIVDVLPRASVLQFNPKKKFKTLRGGEKQGEISGKHQRNKYDIDYDDGGKDASVDGEFIWLSDGSIKEEFEVGDKVVVAMPNILGNRSWLQPVDWNQGGYDAVYFDTKVNKVIFIQVTRSDKHTFKMRFFKEVLIKLRSAGMRCPSVEVFFVVKLNQLMNFSISSIDDRGAIEEFDNQWIGPDEDHVKVRAFKATPAQ
ncbi:hypothetical protein PR001_g13863 [Phytophthora rubi]|uniref:Uncharacterized protein n=1 Tax=Phytophthora rubi TaxID=129364 RepID=A0A6A3LMW5_9STRA|nr:hypothetical protein PR002_g14450 [Phytophthora rubi]KAE9019458.1 hypothetical protein PR001_g13863 [Phytophthora rubi]